MAYHSILFADPADGTGVGDATEPACFPDLNLDQVVQWATQGREEYNLKPFFYRPLREVASVRYRQDVMRDLERPEVYAAVESFADGMRLARKHLATAGKVRHRYQKGRWFLDAVTTYCETVRSFVTELGDLGLRSGGLLAFREYLAGYAGSARLSAVESQTRAARQALDEVRYGIRIKGNRVTVSRYEDEADYSVEIEETFEKFRQGAVKDHRVAFHDLLDMNHVESRILDLAARLHPEPFQRLDDYCEANRGYLDERIAAFDREIQFYVAYLDLIAPLRAAGLTFSYPEVSTVSKAMAAADTFDIALAIKLNRDRANVVCNDVHLDGPERVIVVTGPNQGGKTTFARMFGQLHYLASLGLQVPGRDVRVFLPDRVFTHFEREEDIATLRGKLEDELFRIHAILAQASRDSVLVMNESFGSTTLSDALFLGQEVMDRIIGLDLLCVYVTFVDELASLGETTVSMVATVVPDDPALRTYKIVRMPANGLAYAAAIAGKYRLTYEALTGRLAA